jgi:hypothetical protein
VFSLGAFSDDGTANPGARQEMETQQRETLSGFPSIAPNSSRGIERDLDTVENQ